MIVTVVRFLYRQGSPRLHTGPGGQSSPTPMQYQQYTQRYSSPTRPHAPYSHHQVTGSISWSIVDSDAIYVERSCTKQCSLYGNRGVFLTCLSVPLQLNSYTTQTSHPSSLYTEQRGWNQGGPPNPPPPPSNQVTPSGQSPQRALSQSPAPPPAASPQPQATSQSQVSISAKACT